MDYKEVEKLGYRICSTGDILSLKDGGWLPIGGIENNKIRLSSKNKLSMAYKTTLVDRIIIATFHPMFINGKFDISNRKIKIIHVNGDTLDNDYDNLEADINDVKKPNKEWFNIKTGESVKHISQAMKIEQLSKTQWYNSPKKFDWIKRSI